VPFRALGTELTPDTQERTSISVISAFCTKGFYLLLPWVFPLSQSELFDDPVLGIRVITALCSLVILATGWVAAKVAMERYQKVAEQQEKVKLFFSFKSFLKDRCFLTLHFMGLGLLCSIMLVDALGLYVNLYYVWEGDIKWGSSVAAMGANITQVLSFLMLIVIKKWLMKLEKKTLIMGSLWFAIAGSGAKWFLFDPQNPYLPLLMPVFFAPAYTGLWAIFMSMLGDFCDYDEHRNGKRREGVFGSISGWVMKAGGSGAVAVSGLILTATGFDKDLGGAQGDDTFLAMRLLFIFVPLSCFLITLVMNALYPLNRAKMEEIRSDLESRRGVV
jgi:GPH family glycoside/pentoside/hexuronide:cation symporter